MIYRQISDIIINFINKNEENKNVLVIDGVRQVGKTTAVYQALQKSKKDFLAINLEKEKVFSDKIDQTIEFHQFENLLLSEYQFKPGQNKILFIDEANESLRLGAYVRQMKEDWKNQTTLLSGSMMHRLFRDKSIRIPVGRFETLTVRPFSFFEFLQANEEIKSKLTKYGLQNYITDQQKLETISGQEHDMLITLLDHYSICGGLPKSAVTYLESNGNIDQVRLAQAQFLANLKEDFCRVFDEEYANLFDRAIVTTANVLGHPYKKSLLIKNNYKLADNIFSVLEKWGFIFKVDQKTFSPSHSISFLPKRYLLDTGIAKYKRELGFPSLRLLETLQPSQREPLGGLLEQLACQELMTSFFDLCGFKEKTYEVDFIVRFGLEMIPVECKAALKINTNQYKGLDLYHQRYQNKKAVVLSLAPFSKVTRAGYEIIHVPIYAVGCLREMVEGLS